MRKKATPSALLPRRKEGEIKYLVSSSCDSDRHQTSASVGRTGHAGEYGRAVLAAFQQALEGRSGPGSFLACSVPLPSYRSLFWAPAEGTRGTEEVPNHIILDSLYTCCSLPLFSKPSHVSLTPAPSQNHLHLDFESLRTRT